MDDYQQDPPNPFSSSPSRSPLDSPLDPANDRPWANTTGASSSTTDDDHGGPRGSDDRLNIGSKPLPPDPPSNNDNQQTQLMGLTAGYPDLNLYPSAGTSTKSRLFEDEDDEVDEEEQEDTSRRVNRSMNSIPAYPDLDLYPSTNKSTGTGTGTETGPEAGFKDNQPTRPNLYASSNTSWSNSPSSGIPPQSPRSPPQSTSQAQAQAGTTPTTTTTRSPPLPTHRPTFPSPGMGGKSYIGPKVKEEACCDLDEVLTGAGVAGGGGAGAGGVVVEIIDAVKTNDGGRASYITYVIRTGTRETHHRYSHFDSLRTSLQALYPVLIVPPIPSKQSLTDYAVKGSSKAKEDATVIARRMRTLEDFLRRVARHPILGGEHVFHRFLDGVSSWNDVLHSPPLSLLPKNPLHAPTYNPTIRPTQPFPQSPGSPSRSAAADDLAHDSEDPNSAAPQSPEDPTSAATSSSYIAHHLLPNVSAATPLKHPDGRFLDSEAFTDKFAHHLSSVMERVNRRVFKRWGERSHGASELGAVVNGLSLDLDDGAAKELLEGVGAGVRGVQEAVEKFGQAVDAEQMSTSVFLQQWERSATEPLHIYAQYGQIIRQRLSFRHQKHVQYELVQATLEHQREKLEVLEKAERESKRLEEALESGGRNLMGPASGSSPSHPGMGQSVLTGQSVVGGSVYRETGVQTGEEGSVSGLPRTPTKKRGGAGVAGGYGLLSAVKHSLSGMMDVDPEATRRANIGRTRDNISQLEDSLQAAAQDLKYASQTLQADLDRFQRQKVADMRDMTIAIAEMHREWAKINLKAWEEAKLAIQSIEAHPNRALKVDEPEAETETRTPELSTGSTRPPNEDRLQREESSSPSRQQQQQRSFTVDRAKTEAGSTGYSSQTTLRGFASPVDGGFEAVQSKPGNDERSSASDPLSVGVKDHPL